MKKEIIVISAVWCPSCLILKKELKKLHEEGIIRPLGKGRSAKWLKVGFK